MQKLPLISAFLKIALPAAVCALLAPLVHGADSSAVGKRYPSEKHTLVDRVTGRTITVLTASSFSDSKPYQTHDTWTADGRWLVFRSQRAAAAGTGAGAGGQIFVVNEITGDIVQLTDNPVTDTGSINLSRKEMKLFYKRGGPPPRRRAAPADDAGAPQAHPPAQVIELDLGALLADSLAGQVKAPESYERVVVTLPADAQGGGFALDAGEKTLYWNVSLWRPEAPPRQQPDTARDAKGNRQVDNRNTDPAESREAARQRFAEAGRGKSAIRAIDIATGEIRDVITVDLRMGHMQANPWTPGEIIYCHETTGDVPPPFNRIWAVNADGTNNRPAYAELPDEWVTHETVAGPDELLFNIMGHLPYLREHGTGIAVVNLRTREMKLLGQVEEPMPNGTKGGFWHCNGSPDGRWAVGDTFLGSVYAINRATGKRTLLTAGHKMRPDHTHPIVSPDSKRVAIQSGLLTDGKALNIMVVSLPEE
ncbi:MAG: oligogalacturonate lyase family protein [Opitutaceae bacterium]|jgi:oligogalacturonide lyase|nr:oligogalacturonate lyase family protein [Opitutaceae bacterium]